MVLFGEQRITCLAQRSTGLTTTRGIDLRSPTIIPHGSLNVAITLPMDPRFVLDNQPLELPEMCSGQACGPALL